MAVAEKKRKSITTKPSKRKATTAKKTTKTKTKTKKVTQKSTTAKSISTTAQKTTKIAEKVVTSRQRRVLERAEVKTTTVVSAASAIAEEPAEILAVKVTDVAGVVYDEAEYQEMIEMYESTLKSIKEGEIVMGTILDVTRDDVIVDVGFKSEGIIPIDEFPKPVNISVGDEIDVYLEQIEDSNGQLILSKQKADFMRVWDKIRDIYDSGQTVEGRVVRRIKGGLVVDVLGVDAFLPGSQVALRQVPDFDALISKGLDVKIIKINKNRRNIVVSRRVVLEEEREEMRGKLLDEIEVEQVRPGMVKNITDFGVFIDLGGVDGLLHITDMSWGRIRHPSEMVSLGETIDVKILDIDEKTGRISLGLKQMTPYPWENVEEKFPVGDKVKGRVVSITDYGAFVELEKGIEGLIHISEMSWTQHIKHPSKIMSANDQVEAVVLSVDKENEKISLGIKQMEPDPWQTIEEKYPVGKDVRGNVRNLTAFGAFVELEEGIDGLVHISDMSWTRRIQHPSEIMKKGDDVDIKILKVDHDNRRISLGYKQLIEDPWPVIAQEHSVGSECLGKVIKVLDRGVVVSLDDEVEGFIPSAQLSLQEVKDPSSAFNQGDEIPLQVIEIDPNQRKIVLSVNAYFKKRGQAEFDEFLTKHPTLSTQSIGEAMPKELKTQKESSQAVVSEAETQADSEGVPAEAVAETKTEATAETEVEPETETKGDSEADDSESKEQL
ncbi:MAG: 30S ribosomal protein S1 [candidate division Zixibacteria bacterium]|nr:30S ribosomal protein S1 [candidate division Zixibacteria bacterium]